MQRSVKFLSFMLLGDSNIMLHQQGRKYSTNLLWMEKVSLEDLLCPSQEPKARNYLGRVHGR